MDPLLSSQPNNENNTGYSTFDEQDNKLPNSSPQVLELKVDESPPPHLTSSPPIQANQSRLPECFSHRKCSWGIAVVSGVVGSIPLLYLGAGYAMSFPVAFLLGVGGAIGVGGAGLRAGLEQHAKGIVDNDPNPKKNGLKECGKVVALNGFCCPWGWFILGASMR